ncbi:hypothetical protein AGMMS49959_09350 [Planctomycetales bacterium]|nr:hypothetical protein AGMMS49959_09350 [Planctomycetales bacterium]
MKNTLLLSIKYHLPYFNAETAENATLKQLLFDLLSCSFLPLLNRLERLEDDNVDYGLTVVVSPTFISHLNNEKIIADYADYLRAQISRAANVNHYKNLLYWLTEKYKNSPLDGLANLASYHHLDLVTTAATNALLSLLAPNETAAQAQIAVAAAYFKRQFHANPAGFYVPAECFYVDLTGVLEKYDAGFALLDSSDTFVNPLWLSDHFAVFNTDKKLTPALNALLAEAQKSPDELSNKYLAQLQQAVKDDTAVTVLIDGKKITPHGVDFIDLLLRKMCYDQKIIKARKTENYLALVAGDEHHLYHDNRWLNNNLLAAYQRDYLDLLPDLHLATLQLTKLKNEQTDKSNSLILAVMARELLLAQSGDAEFYRENNLPPRSNRQHLENFFWLGKVFNEIDRPENRDNFVKLASNIELLFPHVELLNYY